MDTIPYPDDRPAKISSFLGCGVEDGAVLGDDAASFQKE
jgi:hypothetical protein